jgi:phosphoribosylaminoimidazole-succinocarboxamide synthase
MDTMPRLDTPQLVCLHRGKVRDSFGVDDKTRMIVVTDRISAFDSVLETPIPGKGRVLNQLTNFWFDATSDIVPNHVVREIDPSITLVKECVPVRVEMIVRGYISGSMWRGYQKGKRTFSGATAPEGLTLNGRLPQPLVTPTTKEDSDAEITPEGIVATGLATKELYERMRDISLALFHRGSSLLESKGLLMADTKYEFGLVDGQLILMDEIHTPDSSRFWEAEDYHKDPANAFQMDKEYVRQWLIAHKDPRTGAYPRGLPADVIEETARRYRDLYHRVTGKVIPADSDENARSRVYGNLVKEGLIRPGYVAIMMGSAADLPFARKLADGIESYGIKADLRVVSAHKNGERIADIVPEYNHSIEPGAVIAVAGLSNGLGGALAANFNLPVISCPPFKDTADLLANVQSSLMMPSGTPAGTCVRPDNAVQLALRALNLPSLRTRFLEDIARTKEGLVQADREARGRS